MKKKTKTCKSTDIISINILLVLSCVCLDEKHTTEHQKRPSQNMVIHTKKYGTLYQKNMVNCTIIYGNLYHRNKWTKTEVLWCIEPKFFLCIAPQILGHCTMSILRVIQLV